MPGIYFRTISIYRPTPSLNAQGGLKVGAAGYGGLISPNRSDPGNEPLVFSDVPASIQAQALGNTRGVDVPSAAPGPTKWSIFIPRGALQNGDVHEEDLIVDDLGVRYQVASPYYNLLGYKLLTVRLQA